jgi:hypothetical protein
MSIWSILYNIKKQNIAALNSELKRDRERISKIDEDKIFSISNNIEVSKVV